MAAKNFFFYPFFGEISRLQPKEKVLQKEPDGNVNFSCRNFKWKQGEKKGVKFDRQIFLWLMVKIFIIEIISLIRPKMTSRDQDLSFDTNNLMIGQQKTS